MVARVTNVRLKPEALAEAARLFDRSVIPAAHEEEGFMGAMLLTLSDGRAISIDFCDTFEHMQANERNGFYDSQVEKFRDQLLEQPSRECYEVKVARGVYMLELDEKAI